MKTFILTIAIASFSCVTSCTGNQPEAATANEPIAESTDQPVVTAYIQLKNALVLSDVAAASAAAGSLAEILAKEGADSNITEAASGIASGEDVDQQRVHFKIISDHLIKTINSGSTGQTLFIQYCPMAFDNDGASWISLSEDIRNPYFGDQMLHCGSVEKIIE
ncbi:MAG: hypothetical protein DHS20C17_33860 [Cyclobacteriaceae bacterium]|nr:MAG: hypothetical protein DHS20C17_33860 [Cyclobacteriaceae bacterium]